MGDSVRLSNYDQPSRPFNASGDVSQTRICPRGFSFAVVIKGRNTLEHEHSAKVSYGKKIETRGVLATASDVTIADDLFACTAGIDTAVPSNVILGALIDDSAPS